MDMVDETMGLPRTVKGTFIHLPGIGHKTEHRLWEQGITTWKAFRRMSRIRGISNKRKAMLDGVLEVLESKLDQGKLGKFIDMLPFGEHWRVYRLLEPGVRYLDIETTGLSSSARVTVIGIAWPNGDGRIVYRALVRGFDLTRSAFNKAMKGATCLITFNGSTFDLPMIRRELGDLIPNVPHLDLRHLARKVGLHGGLKSLERRLGIARDAEVQMLAGYDAVRLWRTWERKRQKRALEILVDYNREDVVNLAPLTNILYGMLERTLLARLSDKRS